MTATVVAAPVTKPETAHALAMAMHKEWLHKTIIRFIDRYHAENYCSPSWGEVAEAAGFATKSGITRHLQEMKDLGLVTFQHGKYRSLAVLPKGTALK